MNYPIIGQVGVGDRLTPLAFYRNPAENRTWLLICCLPNGRSGWVAGELMSAPPPLPTPATIPPPPLATATPRTTATPAPTATPEKGEPPPPPPKEDIPTPRP